MATMGLGACSMLDKHPLAYTAQEDFYQDEKDLQAAMRGVYKNLSSTALYRVNMIGLMGLDADLLFCGDSRNINTVADNYVLATDSKVTDYWRAAYSGIFQANLLLANIHKAKIKEEGRDYYRGHALFMRAYYYLMLTTRFGDVPLILEPAESNKNEHTWVAKTDRKKVYEQIIADLEEALPLVKSITAEGYGGIATTSSVYAILARASLYMAGWPINDTERYADVLKHTRALIDGGIHSLNPSFEQIFINYAQDKYDIKESIFEAEFWGNGIGAFGAIGSYVTNHYGQPLKIESPYGFCSGWMYTSGVYYSEIFGGVFDSLPDNRANRTISTFTYNVTTGEKIKKTAANSPWNFKIVKFLREDELLFPKGRYDGPSNFPIVRYSDVLLMFAEAWAAYPGSDPADEALAIECLNKVRRRGHSKPVDTPDAVADYVYTDKAALLDFIQDERAREFGAELLRKDDLVRWGIFYDRMRYMRSQAPDGTPSGHVYSRTYYGNVQARDVLWPIPSAELAVNRLLKQNPGW